MDSTNLLKSLESEFNKHSNLIIAKGQKAYMRNQFDFYGLRARVRREIQKPLFSQHSLLSKPNLEQVIRILWTKKERDYQYCAQELLFKNAIQFTRDDIKLFEFMITTKSWWDTIDFLAPKIIGYYFNLYPEEIDKQIKKWIYSDNIWLQRSCLIFQLKYKENLDTKLLAYIINSLLGSKEFFINKAIGWILREYSKTNEKWVVDFVQKTKLNSLSEREALKVINRKN